MSRLFILTTRNLAVGYRLAGATTVEVASAVQAAATLEELLVDEDGVIAVHAPYFDALPTPLRRRLDSLRTPLVVPLPAGTASEPVGERRQRLLELLRQAIGYEITFGEERTAR
jgi:vacuolar-type H+-ATPase subunit F/Vma7